MSDQPQQLKTSLKLAPKHEAPKPQVAPPAPPGAPAPNAPALPKIPGGPAAPNAQLPPTPPALGVPPSPAPPTPSAPDNPIPLDATTPQEIPAETKPAKAPSALNKILFPVVALLVGLVLGAGGVYFTLSSQHAATVSDLNQEIDKAKKSATARIAEEQKKATEAQTAVKAAEDKAKEIEQKIKAESAALLASKDEEIKIAKTSAAIVDTSKKEIEQLKAQIVQMEQTVSDATAIAEIERKEKERLRYIAQQFQMEVKKYNPKFSPAPPPAPATAAPAPTGQ